jgi:hypothetical protein
MTHLAKLERIRQFVHRTFQELADDADLSPSETILIQNGQYCGRRFSFGKLQAVWFVEEGELKFYGADGSVLNVATVDSAVVEPNRFAA